ncbi:hypothetical protein B0H17DRAFT_1213612 [Mycena rosella]|uniref:Uncharacterized protein n=1 Tax=Mycena rosella TaxID=1033263 RepID=A0AAD7G3X5_MYCRO|nr:hypothetical protein B0H17DRAFT_1213612 [Mycena rosella]
MRETNARCFCASTSKCAGGSANTTDHIKALWTTKLQVHQMLCNATVMRPRGSERKRVGDMAASTDPIKQPPKQPADRNAARSMLRNATVTRPRGSERKRVDDMAASTDPIKQPPKQPADRNAARSMLRNATAMRPHGSERKRVGDEAATTGPISMPRKKSPGISLNFCPNSL